MVQYFPVVTGSLTVTGSINVSGGITASGGISISGSIASASYASTASFVALAQSASNAVSAATASFANTLTVAGNLTAQTLVVQTITSSVDFVTGSTRFGSILGNTHVFSGSVTMNPGGLFVSGSGLVGMGTSTPSQKLTVLVDGSGAEDGITINVGSQGDGLKITQRYLSNRVVATLGQSNFGTSTDSGALRLYDVGGTETIRLSGKAGSTSFINTGNVLIGTTSDNGQLLQVNGTGAIGGYSLSGDFGSGYSIRAGIGISGKGINIGWNTNNDLGFIGSVHNGTAWKALALQPVAGSLLIGTTTDNGAKLQVIGNGYLQGVLDINQGTNSQIVRLAGNSNNQGGAYNYKVVRHYPVVSSGNKLIIPFASQENLNSNTIVKIFGHSARFNARNPLAFSAYFAVGHLSVLSDLTAWGVNGNIASIGYGGGMNVEINFSSAYTSGEANGIFITIEYMTNVPSYSINVAGITMN